MKFCQNTYGFNVRRRRVQCTVYRAQYTHVNIDHFAHRRTRNCVRQICDPKIFKMLSVTNSLARISVKTFIFGVILAANDCCHHKYLYVYPDGCAQMFTDTFGKHMALTWQPFAPYVWMPWLSHHLKYTQPATTQQYKRTLTERVYTLKLLACSARAYVVLHSVHVCTLHIHWVHIQLIDLPEPWRIVSVWKICCVLLCVMKNSSYVVVLTFETMSWMLDEQAYRCIDFQIWHY